LQLQIFIYFVSAWTKIFIFFIDLICARYGKANILFVKRWKYCTHC